MRSIAVLLFIFLLSFFHARRSFAQQTVKGTILDAEADYPLIGATILLSGQTNVGAVTDVDGRFAIADVPLGRQSFVVQYIGYKSQTIPNVLVSAGKEVILHIKLEESVESLEAVVVTAEANKDAPINEMAKVSARTFNTEETMRFSGGRNDVARLAASFAGVSAPNDSRNDIVVRGNSPTGLLWRVEGIPVATTNHFATLGVTGGPVNALNTNLLRTSDFLTGAFPAEYGNANAAVFDINFRNGNPDRYEFTGQVAFTGAELMAEGPLSLKNGSSFVAAYRYGLASIAASGTGGVPYYQDFSFKVNLGQTKWGKFEAFGLGGLSSINFYHDKVDENDLFANPNEDGFVKNRLAVTGVSHTARIDQKTFLKSSVGVSFNDASYSQDNYNRDESDEITTKYRAANVNSTEVRYTFTSALTKKFNARWNMKAGLLSELYVADFFGESRDNRSEIPDADGDGVPDYMTTFRDVDENYVLSQAFVQAEYKFSDDLSMTAGLHSQQFSYSDIWSLEPRAAISYQVARAHRLSLAYGLHSQTAPAPILFMQMATADGSYVRTNDQLDFMKSHHFVLGYDYNLAADWRLKLEFYYQYLYDIPVDSFPSSYSIINEGADFGFNERYNLVNDGTGVNYGVEMTLEKFFSKGYYGLLTASVYDSEYKGNDGVARNTAFNNQYVLNVLAGKEWRFGKKKSNAITFDTKFTTSGGKPYTPIDLEATRANAGSEVQVESEAFSLNYRTYLRWDVKLGYRINSGSKRLTQQFSVDLQNVTNRENEFEMRYNEVTDEINSVKQIGLYPVFMYRIEF